MPEFDDSKIPVVDHDTIQRLQSALSTAKGGFSKLQIEVAKWSQHNFGNQLAYRPLLGACEEIGELCHAHLKGEQKIREGFGDSNASAKMDAIGDIIIYLADYCERSNIDLSLAVSLTWAQVKKRDWKTFPKNGVTE